MDDYPYRNDPIKTADPWGYYKRECVSWAAWNLLKAGKPHVDFGNALTWADRARKAGLIVNSTPDINSVVCLPPNVGGAGSYGHVAWINLALNFGKVALVEDYNWNDTHNYLQHPLTLDSKFLYIHAQSAAPNKEDGMGASFVLPDGSQQARFWLVANPTGGYDIDEIWYTASTGLWGPPVDASKTWWKDAGSVAGGMSACPAPDGTQLVFWTGIDGHQWEAYFTQGKWIGPVQITKS
jgi:surface antigen